MKHQWIYAQVNAYIFTHCEYILIPDRLIRIELINKKSIKIYEFVCCEWNNCVSLYTDHYLYIPISGSHPVP